MAPRARRSARLWIVSGTGLALVSVAVLTLAPVGEHWEHMLERVAELEHELDQASHERRPLGGPATGGRAWDAYDEAFALMRVHGNGKDLGIAASKAAEAGGETRRTETARLVAALEKELDAIQRGARCLDAAPSIDWSLGLSHPLPKLMDTRPLCDVLVLQGLAEIEDGDVETGSAKILDAMQFGQDLTRSPLLICQMIGVSETQPEALNVFLEQEGLSALPREALVILEGGVGRALSSARERPELRGELVFMGRHLIGREADLAGLFGTSRFEQGLTFGLFPRWVCADAVLTLADAYEELERLSGPAFAERARQLGQELRDSENPLLRNFATSLNCEASYRHSIVRLGQLRHALRAALELPPVPFHDPHGAPLAVSDDGETLHLSVASGRYPIELRIKH